MCLSHDELNLALANAGIHDCMVVVSADYDGNSLVWTCEGPHQVKSAIALGIRFKSKQDLLEQCQMNEEVFNKLKGQKYEVLKRARFLSAIRKSGLWHENKKGPDAVALRDKLLALCEQVDNDAFFRYAVQPNAQDVVDEIF